MKRIDNTFHVGEFLGGAKGAYEMILMAFEKGDLSEVVPFMSEDVYDGDIVEGDPNEIKRQKDVWTFARMMGTDDPNWRLVATGE